MLLLLLMFVGIPAGVLQGTTVLLQVGSLNEKPTTPDENLLTQPGMAAAAAVDVDVCRSYLGHAYRQECACARGSCEANPECTMGPRWLAYSYRQR